MMQELPPLPPGLSFTPPPQQGGVPPLPPGLSAAPPRQPAPARPAAPGMAPAPAVASAPPLLTVEEMAAANMASGYDPAKAWELAQEDFANQSEGPDPGMAPAQPAYGVLSSEDISPQERARLLASGEYQVDPNDPTKIFRMVDMPAPPPPPAPAAAPTGLDLALEQERGELERRAAMGVRRYDQPDFLDQFTAPINDEMGWLVGLGSQAAGNLGRRLTGQEIEVSALDRARAKRQLVNEGQQQFEQDRPAQAIAGGVLGGFAFAPARGAQVPGLLGRLGQAGGVSGAYGAAEGDGYLGRAGNAALSAGLGVATAGVLEGGGALLGRAMRGSEPRVSGPDRRVTGALGRGLQRDQMTPQQLLDNMANAPSGQLPFQSGGENLLGLAETMANAPGAARREIVRAVGEQADDASNRISARLADAFGAQGNGFQSLRQRVTARGEAANTGMGEIADAVVSLDDAAVQALRSQLARPAVNNAAEEAIAELTPEGQAAANRLFGLGDRLADMPAGANITVREAQDISYALKEAAGRAYRGGFNTRGEALQNLSSAIRNNARTPERGGVQAYDDWLKSFGDASEAIDGQRVGLNVFAQGNEKNAMSASELADRWTKWPEQARENFRLGVGEAILSRVRSGGGVAAMRQLLRDEEIAARVRVAFDDDDAFRAFMQTADDEVRLANTGSQAIQGSATARRAAGRADLEQQGFDPVAMAANGIETVADFTNPVGAARQGARLAARSLPLRDRSIVGDDELNALIGAAMTDEAAMTRLLNLMQTQEGMQKRVAEQSRRMGLLATPGAVAGGQERTRGLLTTSP